MANGTVGTIGGTLPLLDDRCDADLGDDVLGQPDVSEHAVGDSEESPPVLFPGAGRR